MKLGTRDAAGISKVVNLSADIGALGTFLFGGKVDYALGIAAALFCMAGSYFGAGLVGQQRAEDRKACGHGRAGSAVCEDPGGVTAVPCPGGRPFALLYSGTICDMISCDFLAVLKGAVLRPEEKNMKWKKFTLKTTTEAVDYISSLFDEIGIQGIEIEDNVPLTESETKGMFIDILPELPPDHGTARVSFYLDDDDDAEAILNKWMRGFLNCASTWRSVRGPSQPLRPRTRTGSTTGSSISSRLLWIRPLIKPTWEEIPEEHKDKLLIQIDPGTAFGTGKHETTQLCIRQLEKYVKPGVRILDLGTGSGILGITALKPGAGSVFGTDLDENAITAVHENLEAERDPGGEIRSGPGKYHR